MAGGRGTRAADAAAAAARLEDAGTAWDQALAVIDTACKKQIAAPGLQEPAKKALATLDREWDGLAAHRQYPMVSLDNNASERALRRPVVTRKNAYGSRNEDAARLAARIWTVTATAEMAGLNVLTFLTAYLDACGRNSGKPRQAPPWNGSCPGKPRLKTSKPGHSRPRPDNPAQNSHRNGRHPGIQSRRPLACPLTGLPNTYRRSARRSGPGTSAVAVIRTCPTSPGRSTPRSEAGSATTEPSAPLLLVAVSNAACRGGWLNAARPVLGHTWTRHGWTPVAVLVLFRMVPVCCQRGGSEEIQTVCGA